MNHQLSRTVLLIVLTMAFLGSTYAAQSDVPILNRPPQTVLDIQYSPDGNFLARVYASGQLEVAEISTARVILDYVPTLPYPLTRASIDWSPKGDRLAAGIGAEVYIWDVVENSLLKTVKAGGDEPLVYREADYYVPESLASVEWDSTGTLLLSQSVSSRYTVWSLEKQAFVFDLTIGNESRPVVWLEGEQRISYLNSYLDLPTQELVVRRTEDILEVVNNCGLYHSIDISADQSRIVWGTGNGCIVILDADTGNQLVGYKIIETNVVIGGVSWSPDDSAIVAVDSQGGVQVVDVATGSVTLVAQVEGALYAVDWANTDSSIAYGGQTTEGDTVFAEVDVAEVRRLMASEAAREPEFAVTLER